MRITKKITSLLLVGVLAVSLVGCGGSGGEKAASDSVSSDNSAEVILTVFAAASMTETLEEIGQNYSKEHPNVKVTFNFDSSGTLKTQIEEGAECDLFISAAKKQMDELDITADKSVNTAGLDKVDPDTRRDILENKVTLVVPEDNPKKIESYEDLVNHLKGKDILMAMGNEDVPVGQYTQKILTFFDLDEKELADDGLITYGSNVKEVTTQVSESAADCGIIYSTDAFSAGLNVVDTATEEMCGRVIYPAAVLKESKYAEEAKAFLDYLGTDESKKVFEKVGFTCL